MKQSAMATGLLLSGMPAWEKEPKQLNIGACDWSLGADSSTKAFAIAKQIGLSGISVNLGNARNNFHLRTDEVQQSFIKASKESGVKIASLAIGELNNIPYKSDPLAERLVSDSIDVAKALGVSVVLLGFFDRNDLVNDEAGIEETIRRFIKVMPKAENIGVTLGIESYLSADQHKRIINAVGSENLKVYYDFRNTADAGFDTVAEFKKLGPELICELHIKENGVLLGEGTLDWIAIARAIKETGYYGDGWMQIEYALPDNGNVIACHKKNHEYLRRVFRHV